MKNDIDLKREVLAQLEFDPRLPVGRVGVATDNGVVTLEGFLQDAQERAATERAVKLVPGVKGIVDRIRIQVPECDLPSDAEIAAAAREAIQWLSTVTQDTITVDVRDGWVALRGTVESRHQRNTLEEIMRRLPQARGVENLIEVRPIATLPGKQKMTQAA